MKSARLTAFAATAATAFALAACGGESADDFRADLDGYCVEQAEAGLAALEPLGGPRAPAEVEDAFEQAEATLPVREETVDGLAEFEPPDDLEADFEDFVAAQEEALEAGQEAVSAAEDVDEAGFQEALAVNQEAVEAAREAAADMELVDCAGQLPSEDEEEVTDRVVTNATTAEPSQCTEDFTQSYLDNNFGKEFGDATDDPLEACEQFQDSLTPKDLDQSLDINEITGTRPAVTVTATPTGGPNDGEELTYRVVEEDGAWKINDISLPAPE